MKKEDPKFWLTVLKLVLIAATLIGLVGWGLWYVASDTSSMAPTPREGGIGWGIATDSPIRR